MNRDWMFDVYVVEFAALKADRMGAAVGCVINSFAIQQRFDDSQMFFVICYPHR